MSRRAVRKTTDKVIHIRIDAETHQKLKMHAASTQATIQKLVEELIRDKYKKMQTGNLKP